ncbi:hypothetical protein SAMN05444166_1377 [Singulisphaera sp. GP187]|uniref:hypothetical protein n=1 Tax=Singulisphaera sp. GP187 TaxID=1882752 RepID=UPI000927066C|nr:hypothetical protein [Singulisphaera sp. GP187]SIN87308.1 hypothetical protein SAMN05444166_1377 [Singulisphaera sp. GP187]
MMAQFHLPNTLRAFVQHQKTMPVKDLGDGIGKLEDSPYFSYWYRAVACILLSGRVEAKRDGAPNMMDVNRVGKEANFNQYLTERIGKLLIAMDVVRFNRADKYEAGPNLAAFWDHDAERIPAIARQGIVRLVHYLTGQAFGYPHAEKDSHPIEFLSLFFASFQGLALVEAKVGETFHAFALLPEDDLIEAGRGLGLALTGVSIAGWRRMLNTKGQNALIAAINTAEWAYGASAEKTDWYFASPCGLAMLELGPMLSRRTLATELKVQSDLSVFAGAGLPWETLLPLFRYSTIKRIDQVYEFRLDRKRIAESSSTSQPGEELREALRESAPLPSTVADLLTTKSKAGGKIGIRWCSALLKPDSAETLAAIHGHPKLKGYLEPGAPPGYLLIKSRSDPDNFILRCRSLGFKVTSM